jgi:hypothetical protein
MGPLEGNKALIVPHIIFDVLGAWIPGDYGYNNYEIDYIAIEEDLKTYIDRFMPVRFTFDQFESTGTIQRLRQHVMQREYPKRISIWERTANRALNWETYETFKNAIGLSIVRAPDFELARQELKFLQDVGGRVEPPDTGPITTKDVADCMAILTHDLIGENVAALVGQQLSGLSLGKHAQGGIPVMPGTSGSAADDIAMRFSNVHGGSGMRSGAPVPPGRPNKFNPDGTRRRPGRRRRWFKT